MKQMSFNEIQERLVLAEKAEDELRKAKEEIAYLREQLHNAVKPLRRDTYSVAVETYDRTSRLMLAIEEMSELSKELSKNYRGEDNISAISEEMADVEIMLEQLKLIFRNRSEVDAVKAEKLCRLSNNLMNRHQ